MPQRELHGVNLAWEEAGSGLPVVLLHPFPLNRAVWSSQRDFLSKKYRIIMPDLRGFGGSGLDGEISAMETFADDVAAVMDNLHIGRFILGGLSMGGYVALAFYKRYPERVRGLILANTKALPDDALARRGRSEMAKLAMQQGAGAVGEAMLPKLFGETTFRLKPHVPVDTWRKVEKNSPRGLAAALRGMALRPDLTHLLSQIMCPVLVIAGDEDKLIPASVAKKMADALYDVTYEVIEGAAHLSNLEQPEEFNRLVKDFLEDFPS